MWVYYALLGIFATLIMIKAAEIIACILRRQRDAVRREDWLDLLIEAIITR